MVSAWRRLVGSPRLCVALCGVLLFARLGYGPIIWSRYIGFTSVEIRRIPLSGDVWVAAPSTRWLRARLMATAAAGPLSNAVVLAASVWLLCNASAAPDATVRPVPALVLAVVNARRPRGCPGARGS